MNTVFFVIFTLSALALVAVKPDAVLSSLLAGGEKALTLSLKMAVIYAVWMGFLNILKDSGLQGKLSRALRRPVRALFGETGEEAGEAVTVNLSANMLGMGGVATPMGIRAVRAFEREAGWYYKECMLFVLNATGIQLLPTSVIALRASMGSAAAGDIVLPSLLATAISSAAGVALVRLLVRDRDKSGRKRREGK